MKCGYRSQRPFFLLIFSLLCSTHFVVLVGGDGHELSSWKDEDVMLPLSHVSYMIGLHYVKPWLILVHTVHNDLCTYKDGHMVCVCERLRGVKF